MGGKHKVANRTKNNARPSSSGRSAELLGSSVPQFIGFSGLKDTALGISLITKDELEAALDPNIQLILKKISKKDSTTKIKGLQELSEVIKNSEADSLKALLPVWPRFYNVLATDVDNRVREAVHKTHQQLVVKVKRNIAPYLKQLMAPWFTSQYDTYPPAASAASQAFLDAFPPNKYKEAIMFCQDEILLYINENILNVSSQTSSIYKNLTPEEAEAKYDRVLISCLQGYNLYLEQVPREHLLKSVKANNNIVSNAKFWKFAKSNMPHIKAAWFKVLTVICQKAEILLEGKEKEVVNTVFICLDDNDPTVLPHVWEAALMVMSTVQDWWKYVNVDKIFFPKLMKILRNGGQGNATVLYPNLLPLLSHLPPNIRENDPEFYKRFFDDLRTGLTQKSTLSSRSETLAVATAFVECLQYLVSKNYTDEVFCKTLISSQLIQIINWCLIEDLSCFKSVCKQIAGLVQSWSRNYEKSNIFEKYMIFFFDMTAETLFGTLKQDVDFGKSSVDIERDIVVVTDKQLEFLHSLRHVPKPKRKSQVKFAEEEEETNSTKDSTLATESSIHNNEKYIELLNDLVFKLCERYVEYINGHYCKKLFGNLFSLVLEFDTISVFTRLIEKMKTDNPDATFYNIYRDILEEWYKTPEYSCKHVVDLIFLLFKYITNEEKEKILESLIQYGGEDSLGWCISEALAHPHNTDPIVKTWLKNENVNNYLVSIVDKLISNTSLPPELNVLLKLALTENEDGELWIQKEALSRIIDKLTGVMNDYKSHIFVADICTSLAGYISALVYTENYLLNFGDSLLLALFKLSCNPAVENEIISEETMYETSTAWEDTITTLIANLVLEESKNLTAKFAEIFECFFQAGSLEESHMNHLTKVLVNFLRAVNRSKPLALSEFLTVFLDQSFLKEWKKEVHNLCKTAIVTNGNLCSPYEKIEAVSDDLQVIHCAKYFAGIYLMVGVVASNLEDIEEDEFDEDDEEEKKSAVLILNVLDNCENFFAELLYEHLVCLTYLEYFKNTKYHDKVFDYFVLMELKLKSIFKNADQTFKSKINTILKEKCLTEAWFWCRVVQLLNKKSKTEDISRIYSEYTTSATEEHKLGVIHLTKVLKEHLTYDCVQKGYDLVMDIINLNCLMHCEDIDVQIAEVWMKIEKIRNEDPEFFHRMNRNESLNIVIEIFNLYTSWISCKFETLSQKQWDFGMLLMATWASYFVNIRQNYREYEIQLLISAIVKLFVTTDLQVKLLKEQNVNHSFLNEWDDVLYEGIHDDLAVMWMYLAEQLEGKQHIAFIPLIQNFGMALESINQKYVFRINQTLPKWSKFLKKSCSLLTNPQPSLQIWGYKMLLILVPGLVKIDTEAVNTNTPHKKGLIFEQFKEKLVQLHDIVNTMLMGFKLGEDSCRVEPSTDSSTYTFAYLLLWDILLFLCEQASTELRYQYADWLRNEDMLKNLLNNLFRLMPTEVLQYSEGKSKSVSERFLKKPEIRVDEILDGDKIELLVCWLYSSTLTQLPALVRQWWMSLDPKTTQIVEKVTSFYVSPNLIIQELNEVSKYQSKFKNMVIKTIPATRELIAIYTVDEAQVDLLIALPTNYPLGGLEVQSNKQIGGSSHKQWLLQFKKCVLHQNGRIWDGLSLWNNNLDKKFDGVEECYICFAVLHPGTYQLPKLSCQTCRKKFHSACLYKWFRTSYKSSCPICRNLF